VNKKETKRRLYCLHEQRSCKKCMESFENGIRTVSDNTHVRSKYIGNLITNGSFNFELHYIDEVISLNNCKFGDFDRIYPIGLEIKDITDTARSASYLYINLEIGSEGRIGNKPND
jgi:hypothetical protein